MRREVDGTVGIPVVEYQKCLGEHSGGVVGQSGAQTSDPMHRLT